MSRLKCPSIGLAIPTLNSGSTLNMTLLSLVSQKNVNLSVVVVDSGSTDDTLDICKRWNIEVVYAEPGNMYHAINIGLRTFVNLDWLGYINSDDWLYTDSLCRLVTCAEESKSDVVYGNCDYTDTFGRFIFSCKSADPNDLLDLFKVNIFGFAQPAAIFSPTTYSQMGGFDESYYLCGDADFYLRALLFNLKFSVLRGKPVSCFRLHNNQLSATKYKEMELEKAKVNTLIKNRDLMNFSGRVAYVRWKLSNLPHYLIRLLRIFALTNKFTLANSGNMYQYK